MAFPESFLQELTERSPIEEVVGEYVKFTKHSGANLFGLCPFHSEKTPSFCVTPEKQIYHCFGCGKGGTVIGFIMEIENLSFRDAVAFLARRAGMALPEETRDDPNAGRRERMLTLNRDAARFFYRCLLGPQGGPGRAYVDSRGISGAMVKAFGLGYAPDSWDTLIQAMREKGYTNRELVESGLARESRKGKGIYDAFRNRLMFPVIDVRGSVIGFSGRILGDGEPKYLNSPETLVFNKSRNLFALNLAKKSKSGYILLTEGNIDVVSLHQVGFDSAVASLGTSLTAEQARLISRYANQVIIAYDNDAAGQKAAQRAIGILEKLDLKVKVLQMSGAKDPDEYIRKNGADAFRSLILRSENHVEYQLERIRSAHSLDSDEDRVAFLKEATELIAQLPSAVQREVYGARAAEMGGVTAAVIAQEVERARKRTLARARKQENRSLSRPAQAAQPRDRGIRYENLRSAAAEEGVLRLLWLDAGLFRGRSDIRPEDFSSPLLGRMYAALKAQADSGAPPSLGPLYEDFTAEEVSHLTQILQKPEDLSNGERALSDYIEIMHESSAQTQDLSPEALLSVAEKLKQKKGYGG